MTVEEAAAREMNSAFALRLRVALDAARQCVEQDADPDIIVSPRGFKYKIVDL